MSDVRVIVPVDVELAHAIGTPDTFLITQIDYWTRRVYAKEPDKYGDHYIDGRWWVYNTVKDWKEQFKDMFSKNTIIRALDRLEDSGLVYTGVFNKMGRDRTKWYSVNYENLFSKFPYTKQVFSDEGFPITQNGKMTITQSGEMQLPKMGKALPKNTLPNNSEPKKKDSMDFSERKKSMRYIPTELPERVVFAYWDIAGEDADEETEQLLLEIATYYGNCYQMFYHRKHHSLSEKAAVRATKNLLYSEIEVPHSDGNYSTEEWSLADYGIDHVCKMIYRFFELRLGDGSFELFCTPEILINRSREVEKGL